MSRFTVTESALCLAMAAGLIAAEWERTAEADGMYFPPIEVVESGGNATDMDSQLAIIKIYETGEWDLLIRPKITGDPSDFAWVIPFPVMPEVHPDPVDENFFKNLDDMTTTYFIEENCDRYCGSDTGIGCGGKAAGDGGDSDVNAAGVTVWESGQVGIFEYVILSSSNGESLMTWLAGNDFYVSTKAAPIIDELALEDHYFFAARVNLAAASIRQVSGVGFSLPAGSVPPFYPMRLTAAAGTDGVGVTLWVLDEAGRSWVPSNYPWDVIEGQGFLGDEMQRLTYESRVEEILSAGLGDGFIIQYSTDSVQPFSCESFHGYHIYYDLSSAACRLSWVPSAEMQRVLGWGKTRMHAEIPPASLTRDVELRPALEDELAPVVTWFWWPCQDDTDPELACLEDKYSYNCSTAASRGSRSAGAALLVILLLTAAALFFMTRRFMGKGSPKL